jgi:hypothetical protein
LHTDQQQFPDIPALDPSRIRAPVGSIAGSKSKATLAVGVLAEMMGQAKALNLLACCSFRFQHRLCCRADDAQSSREA